MTKKELEKILEHGKDKVLESLDYDGIIEILGKRKVTLHQLYNEAKECLDSGIENFLKTKNAYHVEELGDFKVFLTKDGSVSLNYVLANSDYSLNNMQDYEDEEEDWGYYGI